MTNHSTPDSGQQHGPRTPNDGTTRFFDWWRTTGLRRSSDAWLGGVAGGVATRLGIDPIIVRGIAIVVAILGGPVLFVYAAAWALVPDQRGRIHLERAIRGIFDPAMVAIGVMAVLTVVPFMRGLWWDGVPLAWNLPGWLESTMSAGWVIALIAAAVWLIVMFARRSQGTPPPAQTAPSHDPWTSDRTVPAPPSTPSPSPSQPSGPTHAGSTSWQASSTTAFAGTTSQTVPHDPLPTPGPTAGWDGAPTAQRGWTSQEFRDEMNRQRAEQHAEREQAAKQRRSMKPGAAFVAIALGLALLAGATAAALSGGSGAQAPTIVITGVASALAVLALATIAAGISGRESGWLGFFTFVAAAVLLITGVFPAGSTISPVGRTTWSVDSAAPGRQQGFVMIAGQPKLDLRGLDDDDAARGGTIDVWLVAGELDVILPEDVPVIVEVSAVVGGIEPGTTGRDRADRRGGVFYRDEARYGRTASPDTTTVRLWTVAGNTVITEDQEAGR